MLLCLDLSAEQPDCAGRVLEHFFLNGQEVARLVKRTALAAGVRGDLPEGEREMLFAGHSLRAGLASSAEVDERFVQKQLGHASAEMTRKRFDSRASCGKIMMGNERSARESRVGALGQSRHELA